jgi:hypothetical protein
MGLLSGAPFRCALWTFAVGLVTFGGAGAAEPDVEELIRDAVAAAPLSLADTATVMDWDRRVLRQGNGSYICFPTPSGARSRGREPMCLDDVWMAWLDAWMTSTPFKASGVGIAYMLAGDAGASATDPYATEPTAANRWVVDGPHLMVIVPDAAQLDGLSADPSGGGPYVMWKSTPYVHVMVPVAEAPALRP